MRRLSVCERESYRLGLPGWPPRGLLTPSGAISPPSPCPPISNSAPPGAAPDVDRGQTVETPPQLTDTKGPPGMRWGPTPVRPPWSSAAAVTVNNPRLTLWLQACRRTGLSGADRRGPLPQGSVAPVTSAFTLYFFLFWLGACWPGDMGLAHCGSPGICV